MKLNALRLALALRIAGLGVSLSLAAGALDAAPRPNILVILADDLGFSDLGSYGAEIETPNLDRLAWQGVRFTQFYTTPRCSPSRAALMTGLYPHEAGVGYLNWDWGRPGYRGELRHDAVTLPEALTAAGYRTYMAGKWHLSPNPGSDPLRAEVEPRESWPSNRGFDRFFGTLRGSGSYYDPATLLRDSEPIKAGEGFYYTDALSSAAVGFLAEHSARHPSQPFFLYLAYTAPHWPLHAPEGTARKYRGRYDAGWDRSRRDRYRRMRELGILPRSWSLAPRSPEVPAWEQERHKAWQARRMEVYAAMVDRMDHGIGRVLEALESTGAADDTIVIFLSDNGACAEELVGIHRLGAYFLPGARLTRSGHAVRFGDLPGVMPGGDATFQTYGPGWADLSGTPFRRHKRSTHEGGIATPLIVSWPAGLGVAPGSLIHVPGHIVDLMPTLLEVAGADLEARAPSGESLLPLLSGGSRRTGPMFWEHQGNRAVRDGRWKLVSRWPGGWELYDLEADRTELHDLAAREPERVAAMSAMYERFAARTGVEPWPWVVPLARWLAALTAVAGLLLGALAVLLWRQRRMGLRSASR